MRMRFQPLRSMTASGRMSTDALGVHVLAGIGACCGSSASHCRSAVSSPRSRVRL
jgi:hypothetical protein